MSPNGEFCCVAWMASLFRAGSLKCFMEANLGNTILVTYEARDRHGSLAVPSSFSPSSRGAEGLSGFVFVTYK